jgi:hypothetical protein
LLATTATLLGCADRWRGRNALDEGRHAVISLVASAHATDPERLVSHLSHTCNLNVDGGSYPVIDLQELVRGAATPRGVNAILVFSPDGVLLHRIEYTTERPLFCRDNRLYTWGDLHVEGSRSEGNELTFHAAGKEIVLRHVEANDLPAPHPE